MKEKWKKLIINLDDVGINDGSVIAAKELLGSDLIKGASVIVPGAEAEEFLRWTSGRPELDIGLHSAVTCEWKRHRWRAAGRLEDAKSFTAEDGCMVFGGEEDLLKIDCQEYEQETLAQIKKMVAAGSFPGHLDNHMWTVRASEAMLETYIRLADGYDLIPHIPAWMLFSEGRKELAEKSRWPVIRGQWFVTGPEKEKYETKKQKLKELLLHLPEGLHVLTIHASADTETAREMIPELSDRVEEYQLLMDEEIQEIIRNMGSVITSFRQIREEGW